MGTLTSLPKSEPDRPPEPGFAGFFDGIMRQKDFAGIFESTELARQVGLRLGAIFALSALYGLVMGAPSGFQQIISSGLKVPILYLLTLFVCFPVLHVVNVLLGSRLGLLQSLALILSALTLNSILLAACAPVALFFILTGSDYHFQKLLHVAIFGFAGIWGMVALWRGLSAMCEKSDLYPRQAIKILRVWALIFGFVGTQMAWTLRPFVGSPELGFAIFRTRAQGRENNFYKAVWQSFDQMVKPKPPKAAENKGK